MHPILKTLQASPFPLTVRAICVQLNKEFNFTEISTLLNIWYKSGTVTIHGENTQGQILYGVKR